MLLNAPYTRLRNRSSMTAAWIELSGMSKHITAKAPTKPAAARAAARAQAGPVARAAIAIAPGKTTEPAATSRPGPMIRLSGVAAPAPRSPPVEPIPKARPITPAERPSSRLAYRTSRADDVRLKKLTVVAQPRLLRR